MIFWSPGMTLEVLERQVILSALSHYKVKAVTANALGICAKTLDNKLEKYGEDDKSQKIRDAEREEHRSEWLARSRGSFSGNLNANEQPRIRPESTPSLPTSKPMSVREREEVSPVLSTQHAPQSPKRGRPKIKRDA